jgi:hypothetical protein
MRTGKIPPPLHASRVITNLLHSLNFNIVSKGQGSNKMSHYLNEAAGEMRDLLMPTLEAPKAKL